MTAHSQRLEFFSSNNPNNYVKWLIDVWQGKAVNEITEKDKKCISFNTVVEKKRVQYYDLVLSRIRKYLSNRLARMRFEKLLK